MIVVPLISAVIWLILPKYRYAATIGQATAPGEAKG